MRLNRKKHCMVELKSAAKRCFRAVQLVILSCLAVYAGCAESKPQSRGQSQGRRPNILLIVLDTLRYDATSLGANSSENTPFLKRLSRQAVHFRYTYSPLDATPPAHFSILTGYTNGWRTYLDRPENALPYQLARIGYDSIGVAANGNLTQRAMPTLLGFGRFACLYETFGELSPRQREELFPALDARISMYGGRYNDVNRSMIYASADRALTLTKQWLRESRRPFFAFINLIDPHDPYFPDPRFYSKDQFEPRVAPPGFDSDLRFRSVGPELEHPELVRDKAKRALIEEKVKLAGGYKWRVALDLTKEAISLYQERYEGEVRELDNQLAGFFDFLTAEQLLDSTVIVITSDHGEAFGEDGLMGHWFENAADREATNRVPLLFVLPRQYSIRPQQASVLTSVADIAPTIYDLLGVDWRPLTRISAIGNYGKSLMPYLSQGTSVEYATTVKPGPSREHDRKDAAKVNQEALERLRALGYIR
jgi:arylsulfatase A-like enzyme